MKSTMICSIALVITMVTGCQGRLRLCFYNDSGKHVVILSEGHEYSVADKGTVTMASPTDRNLTIDWGDRKRAYAFPFGPRPHSTNEYMDGERLEMNIQIGSDQSLLVLPSAATFPLNHTNASARVIKLNGQVQ